MTDWVDILAKATVLFSLAAVVAYALRHRPAALRHLVWSLAIVGAIALPVLRQYAPFRLAILPARPSAVNVEASSSRFTSREPDEEPARTASAVTPVTSNVVETTVSSSRFRALDTRTTLTALWVLGVLAMLLRFLASALRAARISSRAEPLDANWSPVATRVARITGLATVPDIRMSGEVAMPFASGLLRPTIVLPTVATAWTADHRNAVLLHEFAHIRRGDLVMNAISHVARALYWFHPLAWLAAHRLRVEGERACDDAVLRAGAQPSDYAEHLLNIARTVGRPVPTAALAMARQSDFEGRLLAILEPDVPRHRVTRLSAAAIAAMCSAMILSLSALTPVKGIEPQRSVPATQTPAPQTPLPQTAAAPAADARLQANGRRPEVPSSSQQPEGAVAALVDALSDGNRDVRIAAISSLGKLRDPRAIAALAKALREDTDPRVREAAAYALGEIDDARAVPALLDALKSERHPSVREKIVRALGEIDDPTAVAGISGVVKDPSVVVRRAAADALGELDDPSAIPALSSMVRDEDTEVRREVAESLGEFEDPSTADALMLLTRDPDAEVRAHAIDALGDLEDRRHLPAFVAALRDQNAEVRRHAAHAIGNVEELRTVPEGLVDALKDTDREVRQAVTEALSEIGDQVAVPALRQRLAVETDVEVRRATVEALADIGGVEAMQALMALIKDPDPQIRKSVAEALGKRR